MPFNAQRNDTQKFTEGAWVAIMGGKFKLARAGNPDYERALETSGYRKKEDAQGKQRAFHQAVAEGLLRDWDADPDSETRIVDNDGQVIPFSTENAVKVLEDNPDLVSAFIREANDLENFRREDLASQKKLSATGSGSSTSGKAKSAQ